MTQTRLAAAPRPAEPDFAVRTLATTAPPAVFRRLASSPLGLTEREAAERITSTSRRERSAPLRTAVASPFVVLLSGLGLVFLLLGDARGWVTVGAMVVASVGLRWWQQVRSDRALHGMRSRTTATVTVRRRATDRGRPVAREVPVDDVVPGDVLRLSAGDVVPADARVLTARHLTIDQAVLSGEQLPVRKNPPAGRETPSAILDVPSLCFAGTSVVSGTGTAVAITTGPDTRFGALAARAQDTRPRSTVEQGVRAAGWRSAAPTAPASTSRAPTSTSSTTSSGSSPRRWPGWSYCSPASPAPMPSLARRGRTDGEGGCGLVRESGRVFLEASPAGIDPDALGDRLVAVPGVDEVHDLHVWQITSGDVALSAHVLVDPGTDCHTLRRDLELAVAGEYGITHTTLQVDHAGAPLAPVDAPLLPWAQMHCDDRHGAVHREEPHAH